MKKLLTLISAIGMGATGLTGALNVSSCSKKDDKDKNGAADMPLKEGVKIKITVSGDSAKLFADTPDKDGNISANITVGKKAPAALKVDGDIKNLKDVLAGEAISAFIDGVNSSQINDLAVKGLQSVVADVKTADVKAEAQLDSMVNKDDIADISVPKGVYALEKIKDLWNNPNKQDDTCKKNVAAISTEVLKEFTKKINEENKSSIKLTNTNAKVIFDDVVKEDFVPTGAKIQLLDDASDKINGVAGTAHVTFLLKQNIQADGFKTDDAAANFKPTKVADDNAVNLEIGTSSFTFTDTNLDTDQLKSEWFINKDNLLTFEAGESKTGGQTGIKVTANDGFKTKGKTTDIDVVIKNSKGVDAFQEFTIHATWTKDAA